MTNINSYMLVGTKVLLTMLSALDENTTILFYVHKVTSHTWQGQSSLNDDQGLELLSLYNDLFWPYQQIGGWITKEEVPWSSQISSGYFLV